MAYTDFTLENVETELGLSCEKGDLFPNLQSSLVPNWLNETLAHGMQLALISEKARSEYIVAPLLLGVRMATGGTIAILSGHRMDVDPVRRLLGECDFLLARSPAIPSLKAPIMAIVEAKKQDIEAGLGQCIAQMFAAKIFNERAGQSIEAIYGCVTTGEDWQFLRLMESNVLLDRRKLYIDNVGLILGAFEAAVGVSRPKGAVLAHK